MNQTHMGIPIEEIIKEYEKSRKKDINNAHNNYIDSRIRKFVKIISDNCKIGFVELYEDFSYYDQYRNYHIDTTDKGEDTAFTLTSEEYDISSVIPTIMFSMTDDEFEKEVLSISKKMNREVLRGEDETRLKHKREKLAGLDKVKLTLIEEIYKLEKGNCDCPHGTCKQSMLASDEVDHTCYAVYGKEYVNL